jgi:hypothetical protein
MLAATTLFGLWMKKLTTQAELAKNAAETARQDREAELNGKIKLIQAEAAAAKERAGYAARAAVSAHDELQASRKERSEQYADLKTDIAANTLISAQAFDVANGHNEKIAQLRADMADATFTQPKS